MSANLIEHLTEQMIQTHSIEMPCLSWTWNVPEHLDSLGCDVAESESKPESLQHMHTLEACDSTLLQTNPSLVDLINVRFD